MGTGSAIAIYFLFWWACAFVVLPFQARTSEEMGAEKIRGQADSAPHAFSWGVFALRTTIVSAVLFALYYANYVNGWISAEAFDLTR